MERLLIQVDVAEKKYNVPDVQFRSRDKFPAAFEISSWRFTFA
jgi:hypothetical protein